MTRKEIPGCIILVTCEDVFNYVGRSVFQIYEDTMVNIYHCARNNTFYENLGVDEFTPIGTRWADVGDYLSELGDECGE